MGLEGWLAMLLCILAGGGGTLAWARRVGVVRAAAVGLAVQGALTICLYLLVGLWAPDAVVYDTIGQEFAAHWDGGPVPSLVADGKEAFPLMLGVVYALVGHVPVVGLAMNWVAHGLLIVMLASLARRLDQPVRTTAWVVALFPPGLFWSALLLRESITWLLMATFVYALVGISRRINLGELALMAAALGALMWFRGTAAIILAAAGMVGMVLTANRRTIVPRLGVVALALLVLAPRLTDLLAGYTTIDAIEEKRAILADTAASSFDSADVNSASTGRDGGIATSLIDSVLRVTFGPYPWEWPELGAAFALDGILWLMILGLAVVGWWRARNRRHLLLLVLPALALTAALMITSGNYGTMQRLRAQTSVLLIPVAAAGLRILVARVRERRTGLVGRPTAAPESTDSPL